MRLLERGYDLAGFFGDVSGDFPGFSRKFRRRFRRQRVEWLGLAFWMIHLVFCRL